MLEAEEKGKEIIRLKTIIYGQEKQLHFQEPVHNGQSADKFFTERIDDFVRIEEMLLSAEENEEQIDYNELAQIIQRLDMQSGPYGLKRTELLENLFKSILEMSLPGFIEYLFYGYEQRENETGFFNPENFENNSSSNVPAD